MTAFTDNLEKASTSASKALRSEIKSEDSERRYREMRQEANFVAETYHLLRGSIGNYPISNIFMEYQYPSKIKTVDGEKNLRPDLIYDGMNGDEVVEFMAFWDGNFCKGTMEITAESRNVIEKYYSKLLTYKSLPDRIVSLTLVVAYLGPEELEGRVHFNLTQFRGSVMKQIPNQSKLSGKNDPEIHVIVC